MGEVKGSTCLQALQCIETMEAHPHSHPEQGCHVCSRRGNWTLVQIVFCGRKLLSECVALYGLPTVSFSHL